MTNYLEQAYEHVTKLSEDPAPSYPYLYGYLHGAVEGHLTTLRREQQVKDDLRSFLEALDPADDGEDGARYWRWYTMLSGHS